MRARIFVRSRSRGRRGVCSVFARLHRYRPSAPVSARHGAGPSPAPTVIDLCVPKTASTACDQAIFVDRATDASVFSYAVLVEAGRLRQRFQRCGCVQETVRPVTMVMGLVLAQDPPQMVLVPDEGAGPRARGGIPRSSVQRSRSSGRPDVAAHGPDAGAGEGGVEGSREVRAAVADHELDPI